MKVRRFCKFALPCLAGLALSLVVSAPTVAQMDMTLMMKWASVTVVHYEVVGDFAGDVIVVNAATNGVARVTDRVELSFNYDQTTAQLVGEPRIRNAPSTITALRNGAEGCTAPDLKGPYEHWTVESIQPGYSGLPELVVRTNYPAAQMPFNCTSAFKAVSERQETEHVDFTVPGPTLLAMGADAGSSDIKIATDRKSFTVKRGGWTFVYTPTPAGATTDSDLDDLQLDR